MRMVVCDARLMWALWPSRPPSSWSAQEEGGGRGGSQVTARSQHDHWQQERSPGTAAALAPRRFPKQRGGLDSWGVSDVSPGRSHAKHNELLQQMSDPAGKQ